MKNDKTTIAAYFEALDGKKGDLHLRCEQYARWTVPAVFPHDHVAEGSTQQESETGNVSIGARIVNHLAHRIVDTMFPNDKPFFAIGITAEAERQLAKEADPAEYKNALAENLAAVENEAMRGMNLTAYRPVAVNATVLQIVTGNAIIRRMDDDEDSRIAYSVRDYVLRRSISGQPLECVLRDSKLFGELPESVQEEVKESGKGGRMEDDSEVVLYTYYYRELGTSRWIEKQAVEDIDLEGQVVYKKEDFPLIIMAWDLGRGDHYGRGLVEAYSVLFHNVDILTVALIDMIGMAADIKYLVNPASGLDIDDYNNSPRGAYVAGTKDDVSTPDFQFAVEVNMVADAIAKWERELSQAFLLQSSGVRDAERVTAEEIRFFAREIESAFGGLYSRLALDWQRKEAEYQISKIDFATYIDGMQAFDVTITTGLETLSREGKLDALRLAIMDLQMLEAVPEEIRAAFHPIKFSEFIFRNRGVPAVEFLYSQEEFKQIQEAKREQEMAAQAQAGEQQAAMKAME